MLHIYLVRRYLDLTKICLWYPLRMAWSAMDSCLISSIQVCICMLYLNIYILYTFMYTKQCLVGMVINQVYKPVWNIGKPLCWQWHQINGRHIWDNYAMTHVSDDLSTCFAYWCHDKYMKYSSIVQLSRGSSLRKSREKHCDYLDVFTVWFQAGSPHISLLRIRIFVESVQRLAVFIKGSQLHSTKNPRRWTTPTCVKGVSIGTEYKPPPMWEKETTQNPSNL